MLKSIIAAIAIMSAISVQPAHATDWWILDAQDGQCVKAATIAKLDHVPEMVSPYAYQAGLRAIGTFKELKITRDNEGAVSVVRIIGGKSGFTVLFTTTRGACENELQRYVDNGTIVAKRELN